MASASLGASSRQPRYLGDHLLRLGLGAPLFQHATSRRRSGRSSLERGVIALVAGCPKSLVGGLGLLDQLAHLRRVVFLREVNNGDNFFAVSTRSSSMNVSSSLRRGVALRGPPLPPAGRAGQQIGLDAERDHLLLDVLERAEQRMTSGAARAGCPDRRVVQVDREYTSLEELGPHRGIPDRRRTDPSIGATPPRPCPWCRRACGGGGETTIGDGLGIPADADDVDQLLFPDSGSRYRAGGPLLDAAFLPTVAGSPAIRHHAHISAGLRDQRGVLALRTKPSRYPAQPPTSTVHDLDLVRIGIDPISARESGPCGGCRDTPSHRPGRPPRAAACPSESRTPSLRAGSPRPPTTWISYSRGE